MAVNEKVIGLLREFVTEGVSGPDIRSDLKEVGFDDQTIDDSIYEAYRPEIEKMEQEGDDRSSIIKELVDAGYLSGSILESKRDKTLQAVEDVNAIAESTSMKPSRDPNLQAVEELNTFEKDYADTGTQEEAVSTLKKADEQYRKEEAEFYKNIPMGVPIPLVKINLDMTPEEKFNALMNMKQQFTPFALDTLGMISNKFRGVADRNKEEVDKSIIESMAEEGYKVSRVMKSNGEFKLVYEDEKGNKKDLTRNLWDSIMAEKFTISATVATGIALSRKLKGKGVAGALFGLGVTGSVAFATGGLDYIGAALEAREKIDEVEMAQRMLDAAGGEISLGALAVGVGIIGKGTYKGTKSIVSKVLSSIGDALENAEGAMRSLSDQTGMAIDEIAELAADMEVALGQKIEGTQVQKGLKALMMFKKGGQDVITNAALDRSRTGGAAFREAIESRTKEVYKEIDKITGNSVDTRFRTALRENEMNIKAGFTDTVNKGVKNLDSTDFAFKFDDTVTDVLENNLDNLSPSPAKDRAIKYFDDLKDAVEADNIAKVDEAFQSEASKITEQISSLKNASTQAEDSLKKARLSVKNSQLKREASLSKDIAAKTAESKKLDTKIRNARKAVSNNKTEKGKAGAKARLEQLQIQSRRLKGTITNAKAKESSLKLKDKETITRLTNEADKAKNVLKQGEVEVNAAKESLDVSYAESLKNSQSAGFESLLKTRVALNKFIRDNGVQKLLNERVYGSLKRTLASIDAKIEEASKMMPDGKEWLSNYKFMNTEYSKMQMAKERGLYKAIMTGDPTKVADKFTSTITDPNHFRTVLQQLPEKKKVEAEGAVLQAITKKSTYDDGAINYMKVSDELDEFEMFSHEANKTKKLINYIGDIFKNDEDLYKIVKFGLKSTPSDPSLASTPLGRFKMKFVVQAADFLRLGYSSIVGRLPLGNVAKSAAKQGDELALTKQVAKVLDNPLNEVNVKKFLKMLPPDHELRNTLTEYQRTYAAAGKYKDYREAKVISITAADGKVPIQITPYGKFQTFLATEKNANKVLARTNKGETVTKLIHPNDAATPEKINLLFGRKVDLEKELKNPSVRRKIFQKYEAINIEDRVFFPIE